MDHATPMDTDDARVAPTVEPDSDYDDDSSPSSHTTDNESSDGDDDVPQPSKSNTRKRAPKTMRPKVTRTATSDRRDNGATKSGTRDKSTEQPKQAGDVKGAPAEAPTNHQEPDPVDCANRPTPPTKPKKAIPKLVTDAIKSGKTTLAMAQMQGCSG